MQRRRRIIELFAYSSVLWIILRMYWPIVLLFFVAYIHCPVWMLKEKCILMWTIFAYYIACSMERAFWKYIRNINWIMNLVAVGQFNFVLVRTSSNWFCSQHAKMPCTHHGESVFLDTLGGKWSEGIWDTFKDKFILVSLNYFGSWKRESFWMDLQDIPVGSFFMLISHEEVPKCTHQGRMSYSIPNRGS